jgi:hypothetical protein
MNWPAKIPVTRMEDDHTHYIGKYAEGNQFWACDSFVFTQRPVPEGENWENYRREYALLYLFDKDGNLLNAAHHFAGTTNDIQFDITSKIEEMISELGEYEFCDIEVKPFSIKIDGYTFGLIPNESSEMIELQPGNTIAFGEPWDGEYWT